MENLSSQRELNIPRIFLAMGRAIERLCQMPDKLRVLSEAVDSQRRLLQSQGEVLQQQHGEITALRQALGTLSRRQEFQDATSRQVELLSEQHYIQHIIEPLSRRFMEIIDLYDHLLQDYSRRQDEVPEREIFQAMRANLVELLAEYGIQERVAIQGTEFDAKWMRPGGFLPTECQGDHQKVHVTIRCGFVRGDCVLRPALVTLLRHEPASIAAFSLGGDI